MTNFKREIGKVICEITGIELDELESYIEVPKDTTMGDYAFPCFRLAKSLKKAPPVIAMELKEKIDTNIEWLEKVEVVGGYLNFYMQKETLVQEVIKEFTKQKENYGTSDLGKGKNIIVEYSSPNIAKPFHIGHLRSTVIGSALYKIYRFLGYHTIGINHLGDYGTQFGKMIEGYKRWGEEYDIEHHPIDELSKIYIRINQLCKEDEKVLEICRDNFKRLEEGDPYCVKIWNLFRELSLKEFQRIYDLLHIQFDSLNGEAFYSDKMEEVISLLEKSGKLIESQGAKIIDLEEKNMAPCMIVKSNGSTTYATRDLAAILYRSRTYAFDKALYVVGDEQKLHFKQVFETAKLLGIDESYIHGLEHVPFGMVHLKTGRMSTREGNVIKLEELLQEAIARSKAIIEEKNPDLEGKEEVAKRVGIGAIIFNDLYNSRIKDEIFDWDTILNFQGETGPYMQYIYVRTQSVLEKLGYIPTIEPVNLHYLMDEESMAIIKLIYQFEEILSSVVQKNEPSILARYLMELAKSYSVFYNTHKVMVEETVVKDARAYLTYMVGTVLKSGAELLGMEMPDRM